MDFVNTFNNWKVFRNSEGFLEGYKTAGNDVKRVVTNITTLEEFARWVKPPRKRKEKDADKQ